MKIIITLFYPPFCHFLAFISSVCYIINIFALLETWKDEEACLKVAVTKDNKPFLYSSALFPLHNESSINYCHISHPYFIERH